MMKINNDLKRTIKRLLLYIDLKMVDASKIAHLVCLFVCLFVCLLLMVRSRIFSSYGDVTIDGKLEVYM